MKPEDIKLGQRMTPCKAKPIYTETGKVQMRFWKLLEMDDNGRLEFCRPLPMPAHLDRQEAIEFSRMMFFPVVGEYMEDQGQRFVKLTEDEFRFLAAGGKCQKVKWVTTHHRADGTECTEEEYTALFAGEGSFLKSRPAAVS